MKRIYLIPGHGGHDSGAVGPAGTKESQLNLKISKACFGRLRDYDYKVDTLRQTDIYYSPHEQAIYANRFNPDLSLSIHCNAGGGLGFEAFTAPGNSPADPIATHLLNIYGRAFPSRQGRYDISDGDPDKEARFTVLTKTNHPCVLFECGFIDHPEEEQWLRNKTDIIGQYLAYAIHSYFNAQSKSNPLTPLQEAITKLEQANELTSDAIQLILQK